MLGLARSASSSSTDATEVCSPAGSFRGSTDQGSGPSRGAGILKKKALSFSGIASGGSIQARRFRRVGTMHLRGERRLAEAEGKISDAVKCEQLAIDVTARCALGCTRQRACFALGQLELDDRAGNIPRHVLAANQ